MNKTLDTSFQGTIMTALSELLYRNQLYHKQFLYTVCKVSQWLSTSLYRWLTENIKQEFYTLAPISIYFPKHSYLLENFNRKLEIFEAAGLINFWASTHMDMKYLTFHDQTQAPKQISLIHIAGALQLLTGGLVFSSCSFLVEILWFKLRNFGSFNIK